MPWPEIAGPLQWPHGAQGILRHALYDYYVAKVQQRFAMLLNFLEQILLAGLIIRGFAGSSASSGSGRGRCMSAACHAYVYWFLLGLVLLLGVAAGVF
jgi:NADH-quinone oxidoreductase subunit L